MIKLLFEHRAHNMLSMIKSIYKIGKIPRKWKVAKVILLVEQGKDPLLPRSYRPISILPAMSKVWQNTFKIAIEKYLAEDPHHKNQFGFRKGRSTVDAIMQVSNFADTCKKRNLACILMTIDIKNTFNTHT